MAAQKRPPVVTIMGHVDHGKTTLLDFIRKSRITAREAGGITQHIGAYQIEHKNQAITFIDTPGHAAFNKMRARGAQITDIIILVVAANDGVKPQTIESIRHITEAKLPVIVAINKMDLSEAQPDLVKSQLVEHNILVQGFGGDVEAIEISATTGKGVDTLLDTIQVLAELHECSADPDASLEAVVIESSLDSRRGPLASVIVRQGTLSLRQDIIAGEVLGRVKQLSDSLGVSVEAVLPGSPAEIIGFKSPPAVGEVVHDQSAEYAVAEKSKDVVPEEAQTLSGQELVDLDFNFLLDDKPRLKLIIRADVQGTLEAIIDTLDSESTELLSSAVGQVTEKDIELAAATGALIVSFHTKVSKQILKLAKQAKVRIKSYDVIYELIENLQKQMLKLIDPTLDEVITGEAEILQIFEMRGERIAGIRVKTGEIKKSDTFYLARGEERIGAPTVKSMRHGKDEVQSVKTKGEAGLVFRQVKLDFAVGDRLVAYTVAD
ncbi:MAG: translation initiation factor IF-2 [Candidatus Pacebacteria bacterium]|nr:translation initiation factor IF-2 [Candidatus Paceibacterota bacterium]PIR59922.1 MAG: translation initiation factor IF-2 [Candidatus Pacebacteria bacterium CG10_big_fil_rev_8_21_14_0_10_44_54]